MEFIQQDTHDTNATHALIFLHGLGADGHDVSSLSNMIDMPEDVSMSYVYPHAPTIPVARNRGLPCSAWYDFDEHNNANLEHLSETLNNLVGLVEHLIQEGVASENIIIGGFSQGGSIALHAAMTMPFKLAGICSIGGFLPNFQEALVLKNDNNNDTPIQLLHGSSDEVVPQKCTTQAKKDLESAHFSHVKMQLFPQVGHTIHDGMINTLSAWIQKCYQL